MAHQHRRSVVDVAARIVDLADRAEVQRRLAACLAGVHQQMVERGCLVVDAQTRPVVVGTDPPRVLRSGAVVAVHDEAV